VYIYLFVCLRVALWLPLPGQYFYFQEVLSVLAAKHTIMQANAELHQSVTSKQKKRFGEEIARLQVHSFHTDFSYLTFKNWTYTPRSFTSKTRNCVHGANLILGICSSLQRSAELVKTVASSYDEYVSVKDLSETINRALVAAKKDNDFIYHDRVPEVKDLEHIGKAVLVKATTITSPLSLKFTGKIHETINTVPLL